MPERRWRVPPWAAVAAAVCVGAIAIVAVAAGGSSPAPSAVPFDGRSPLVPEGRTIRVLFELRRPSLGERMADEELEPARQRAYVRSLTREAEALRSSLAARAVRLRDVVGYERVWNGFAATIRTEDLPRVQTLGVRVERVRRFYPAAQPAPATGGATSPPGKGPAAEIALLDSGVDFAHPSLRGRVSAGHDAVGGNASRDVHGTQMAGVLAAELGDGARIRAIRVAGLARREETGTSDEAGTTDQLLDGLEHAVDPDGDGDVEDRAPVALVGVSSPYAGFAGAPEAEAAEGAAGLGTLVVAPAGNEGRRAGRFGTIGSPGAAPAALAVGALEGGEGAPALPDVRLGLAAADGRATLDGHLLGGGGAQLRATAVGLTGPSQADPDGRRRAAGGELLQYFGVDARPRARGRLVIVPARAGDDAGPPPAVVAVAARAAGVAGVVICDPSGEDLRAVPRAAAGDMPVIGLSGDAAERALELTEDDGGAAAFLSAPDPLEAEGDVRPAPASSQGPTYELARKPDLAAPGTARAPVPAGGEALAAGTSFAAARVAAAAGRLRHTRPEWSPSQAAAALVGTAQPVGGGEGDAGAPGVRARTPAVPDADAAAGAPVLAEPHTLSFPRAGGGERRVTLRNPGDRAVTVSVSGDLAGIDVQADPSRVRIAPGRTRRVRIRVSPRDGAPPGFRTGALVVRAGEGTIRLPLGVPIGPPPPAPLGPLRLVFEEGRVRGVRFTAGSVRRDGAARAVLPLGTLTLRLVGADTERELTPPGGATNLLPGEYAYTLTGETLRELPAGTYRFVARARGPGRAARALERSDTFEIEE
ncbi:MAG: S8 family serine peptidase [Thermoleophilaceae bacterium]